MRLLRPWTTVAAAALFLATAAAQDTEGRGVAAEIEIGISLSLTGGLRRSGKAAQRGYALSAAEINKAGGILGATGCNSKSSTTPRARTRS